MLLRAENRVDDGLALRGDAQLFSRGKPGTPKAILLELTLLQGKEEPVTVRQWVSIGRHNDLAFCLAGDSDT